MNADDRHKAGRNAALTGIIGNTFLTIFNIVVGMISGSYALVAEGAHTFSDVATSIIAYIGFRFANKPADEEHPLGHGRAEAISGLTIVVFLAIIAYEIIRGAIDKLFFAQAVTAPSELAGVMAIIGMIINIIMSQNIIRIGQNIHSPAIVADGKHQRVDLLSSLAILIGVIISRLGYTKVDPVIGLFIGLMIVKIALEVAKDNIDNIMGKVPSKELVEDIEKEALSIDGVYGIHDIRINYLGSYATVTFHIELDPKLSLIESHEITHKVQNKVENKIDIIHGVTAHACPYGVKYNHEQQIDEEYWFFFYYFLNYKIINMLKLKI